ncbi:MAG: sucrose synthase [Myxococcota bacterium]
MVETIQEVEGKERELAFALTRRLLAHEGAFLLRTEIRNDVTTLFEERGIDPAGSELARVLLQVEEAVCEAPWIYFAQRPEITVFRYYRVHAEVMEIEEISCDTYLRFKEWLVTGKNPDDGHVLTLDLGPFSRETPKLRNPESIGRGVEFLNRKLSSQLFDARGTGQGHLLDFLRLHEVSGHPLMVNDRIDSVAELRAAVRKALDLLDAQKGNPPFASLHHALQSLGFEPGWGRDATRARETLGLLSEILEAPDPRSIERFLARIPMIFDLVVLSPHGWFGQENVLGRPDTGGQVVYILDQVRALERDMRSRLQEQGVDYEPQILVVTRLIPEADGTKSDQRIEPIAGTTHARILRVPFRDEDGRVVPQWISRFAIWPYLERFSFETEREVIAELGGRPDLVIGNYSDGNLVATLLARRFGVTQCNIAHALEKTKYLLSDLYWKDQDDDYHFSAQFTADLIAMNAADFIVTSTYQEIAGRLDGIGQYESYGAFTMPGLYRVSNGIDVYDPKFNIISPGVDANIFFSHLDTERRLVDVEPAVEALVLGRQTGETARGVLADPSKRPLFTMARLDRIKNLTGLVEWFATCPALRERANLVVIGGYVDVAKSGDAEEQDQIRQMHALFDEHQLDGEVRWLEQSRDKPFNGELYRWIADRGGLFVQPALFEAFGLTVIEAMTSGLPTFATCYGGPLEIIEDGVSGFHIDPNDGAGAATRMAEFLEACDRDPARWDEISSGALARVKARFTWELYAERIMTLSRIYGFWKHVSNLERAETRAYLDVLYGLLYRPLAEQVG